MTTSTDLRREFIKLLESDVEFRYTVAGYLGLSEILRSIERLWEEVRELREEVRKLWENQNKLWEEVRALREDQKRLWEEVRALREGQNKLWENINRLWEEVRSLREGQNKLWEEVRTLREEIRKLWEEVRTLRENQNKLWENVSKLWEEVRALREDQGRLWREVRDLRVLVERLTLTVEDEGRYVIEWRLGRELGVLVSLSRFFIDDVEVDIFGVTDDLVVIGEATVRLGTSLVDELERKVRLVFERRSDLIRPKLIKVIYCDVALPQALKLAEERGIWVLDIRSDLTSRRIHVLK
jgi:uncharacterized protein YoxC